MRYGAYFADVKAQRLFCVVAVREAERDGEKVPLAILEDALTGNYEPWDIADLERLHLVRRA